VSLLGTKSFAMAHCKRKLSLWRFSTKNTFVFSAKLWKYIEQAD